MTAERRGVPLEPATEALERLADGFIEESEAFLTLHQQELEKLELPREVIMQLLRRSLAKFVAQDGAEPRWEVPDDVLATLPERIQVFFRPRRSSGLLLVPEPPLPADTPAEAL